MHRRRGTSDTAAALLAHFGHSAFTPAQAEQIGVSARRIGIAAEAGYVVRLRRGLYLVPRSAIPIGAHPSPIDPHRALAYYVVDELRGREIPATLAEETAACDWDLPSKSVVAPKIRVPRDSTLHLGTRHGVCIRGGDTVDAVLYRGHWVTSPLATARDICRGLPRHQAVALFGLAQRRHMEWLLAGDERMDAGDLTAALGDPEMRAHLAEQMHRLLAGSQIRQRWSAEADPRPESYLEGISWGRFTGWRLGDMKPQEWVRGASGRLYRVDVLINGIAGEADGAVKYASADGLWKEKRRQEDIENGGTPVVRWTYAEAEHHPDLLRARWRAALRRHAG